MRKNEMDKMQEIRTENRKAGRKLVVIMILAAIVGGFIGFASCFAWNIVGDQMVYGIVSVLYAVSPWANIVLTTGTLLMVESRIRRSRRAYRQWDGEDETVMDGIERNLSYALWFSSVDMVLAFFFIAAEMWLFEYVEVVNSWIILGTAGFAYAVAYILLCQKRIVDFEKEINPEKKGSVYDTKFNKIWLESCDEAERTMIYQSAYRAYQTTSMTCLVMWVVCILLNLFWDIGLFPVFIVTVIWGIHISSYCLEAIRLSGRNPVILP